MSKPKKMNKKVLQNEMSSVERRYRQEQHPRQKKTLNEKDDEYSVEVDNKSEPDSFDSFSTNPSERDQKDHIDFEQCEIFVESKSPNLFLNEEYTKIENLDNDVLKGILNEIKAIRKENSQIKNKLNKIEEILQSDRQNERAKQSLLKQSFAYTQKAHNLMKKMTVDGHDVIDIEHTFPMKSFEELEALDKKIDDPQFCRKIILYFQKFKEVDLMMKYAATDKLYIHFNYNGLSGKKALKEFKLFERVLHSASGKSRPEFEKCIKKSILRSHNRFYKMGKYDVKEEKAKIKNFIACK